MKYFLKQRLAAAVCALVLPAAGLADPLPRIRMEAVVSGEIVRLGDLVEHVGPLAGTPLFAAPHLGGIGTIRADRIAEAARELGLANLDTAAGSVIVRRPATTLSPAMLTPLIAAVLAERDHQFRDASLTFEPPLSTLAGAVVENAAPRLAIDSLDLRSGQFAMTLTIGAATHRLAGTADLRTDIPVLLRTLGRGEAVTAADIGTDRRSRRDLPVGILDNPERLVGMVARRTLGAGQPLRQTDLAAPELVERNQPVTVSYAGPGLNLTLRGRAMAGGVLGAIIPIQNTASKRTIDAVVIGAGKVSARLDAPQTSPHP